MAKLNELEGKLDPILTALADVGAQLEKAKLEIIAALQAVNPDIPPGALAKIESLSTIAIALKSASQALDDLNTDAGAVTA